MPTIFSEKLVKLRKEAGFPTAYRFFHDNGGDKVLGMCYRKYLMMEQGRILPQFKHLRAFIFGLRLESRSGAANGLASAWLRTMAGDELYEEIITPLLADRKAAVALSPSQKVLKEAIAGRKIHVTPAQLKLIARDAATYRCFMFLSNDAGAWTAAKLAGAAGVKPALAARVIKDLAAAKLLRKAGAGWRCPLAGAMVEMPHSSSMPEIFTKIRLYQRDLVLGGVQTHRRYGIFRADEDALADLYPVLDLGISSSHVYARTGGGPKSAIFLVESRAIKLADFR